MTRGQDMAGRPFEIVDNWKDPNRAHLVLNFDWTGYTEFKVNDNPRAPRRSASAPAPWRATPPGATAMRDYRAGDVITFAELFNEVRETFPELAMRFSDEFPQLRMGGGIIEGGG